jgi:hypothetical protein
MHDLSFLTFLSVVLVRIIFCSYYCNCIDGIIILKRMLINNVGVCGLDSSQLGC